MYLSTVIDTQPMSQNSINQIFIYSDFNDFLSTSKKILAQVSLVVNIIGK